jgi:predicted kinase
MKVIIAIGVPGCGKTTVLKPLAEAEGMAYVNADDVREELTGNPADHSKEVLVWHAIHRRIEENLRKRGVVVDATHSKRKDRRQIIEFCREHGATLISGYWFNTPLETCLERNRVRQRVVPAEVIQKMHRRLVENPPSLEEGFTMILEIVNAQYRIPRQ